MKIYSQKGFVETYEVAGQVADPDCVYILNASLPPYVIDVSVRALVRRLLDKAGWTVRSIDQILSASIAANSQFLRFTLQQEDANGSLVPVVYDTGAVDTINTVAGAFIQAFSNYSAGFGLSNDSNVLVPKMFQIYQRVSAGADWFLKAEINLVEEYVNVHSTSSIKIQNRTLAANSSADSEDVTSNPIVGMSYMFKGMPKTKTVGFYSQLNRVRGDGVMLVRAAEMTLSTGVGNTVSPREPPLPNLFWNCRKATRVFLNPGKMRTSAVMYHRRMKFLTWLKSIRIQYRITSPNLNEYTVGDVEMFAFEDMINVNATNNITLAYEVNRKLGVYFETVPNKYSDGLFSQQTYSNLPV